jgi:hypothetical protein
MPGYPILIQEFVTGPEYSIGNIGNPGWCWDSKLNLMVEMAGLRYSDLLKLIIEAAQERVAAQHPGLIIPLAERRAAGVSGRRG